jgi:hypothetical protein
MKVMGIEIVRSSTPGAVKDYLKKSLELTLRSTEKAVQSYIKLRCTPNSCKKSMKEVACPTGVNGIETYATTRRSTPRAHRCMCVRALLYNHHLQRRGLDKKYPLIGDGDKIKYVMLKQAEHDPRERDRVPDQPAEGIGSGEVLRRQDAVREGIPEPDSDRILEAVGWSAIERVNLEEFFE